MANPNSRFPENVPGRWYIDESCINCGMFPSAVPEVFRTNDAGTNTIVHCQPNSPEIVAQCDEIAGLCPTNSIGSDGLPLDGDEASGHARGGQRPLPHA